MVFFSTRNFMVCLITLLIDPILNPYLFAITRLVAGFDFKIIVRIYLTTWGVAMGYLLLSIYFFLFKMVFCLSFSCPLLTFVIIIRVTSTLSPLSCLSICVTSDPDFKRHKMVPSSFSSILCHGFVEHGNGLDIMKI